MSTAVNNPVPRQMHQNPAGAPQQQQQQQQQQATPQPHAHHQSAQAQQQQLHDMEAKKMMDMIEALNLISVLRENINVIIDNVGKANTANNYAQILAGRTAGNKSEQQPNQPQQTSQSQQQQQSGSGSVATPSSVSQQQQGDAVANAGSAEPEPGKDSDEVSSAPSRFQNLNLEQQEFFEKTDHKYLQERVVDINKSIVELDKIIKELQPVQFVNSYDFNPILLDQNDERAFANSSRFINNYRWCNKLQEYITATTLMAYKRFQHSYAERKSPKYRSYSNKPIKKEDLEKSASTCLANNEIKVVSLQKTEHQFVLDIIMPQNFKFVLLLFDTTIEKFQVRPLDNRILKIYANNKPSEEICYFDFEHKSLSNVFQRLEENCLFALLHFKTEQGPINHFRCFLQWIKHYVNLFNAKCVRCEKHLLNCVPPAWRDLKNFEAYHDECRIY